MFFTLIVYIIMLIINNVQHQDEELDNLSGPNCSFHKLETIEFLDCTELSSSLLVNALKQNSLNHLRNVDFKWV